MKIKFGMSFFLVLFIVFLTLKLCGVIIWPWVWVAAPLWIPIGIVALIFLGVSLVEAFGFLLKE